MMQVHIIHSSFDTTTGLPKYGNTFQGFSDDSSWARGQAWGILGFALAYGYNKQEIFLERSKQTAHYFFKSFFQTIYNGT